jgi:hypothetical protein
MSFATNHIITHAFRSCSTTLSPPAPPLKVSPSETFILYLFMKIHEITFIQVLHTMEQS